MSGDEETTQVPDFVDDEGNTYYGKIKKNGKPHGKGKMVYQVCDYMDSNPENNANYVPNGEEEGECRWGEKTYVTAGKMIYNASPVDILGSGEYDGKWKDGKRHGKGTHIYDSGCPNWDEPLWDDCACEVDVSYGGMRVYHQYSGKWENDMRHGYGVEKILWMDFVIWGAVYKTYKGNWKNGVKEGKGELKDPCDLEHLQKCENGFYMNEVSKIHYKTYETTWVDGKMNGPCIVTNEDGDKFEGTMVNDKEHGVFCPMKIYYCEGEQLPKEHPKIKKMLAEIEKNKLAVVLNKKVALGTKEDVGEILNSVGY